MIGRFADRWPALYVNAAYPTRDRVIPAGRFVAMCSALDALEAADVHRSARAVTMGKALLDASEKDKPKVRRDFERLERVAYPVITEGDQD